MAETVIHQFNDDARRRIKRTVQIIEGGPNPRVPDNPVARSPSAIWLARATEFGEAGSVVQFTLLYAGVTKGTETESETEVPAYVRRGLVLEGVDYRLVPSCAAGNCHLEVANPSVEIVGKTDEAIAKASAGTVRVYSGAVVGSEADTTEEITAHSRYGAVGAELWVRCAWCEWANAWELVQAEC